MPKAEMSSADRDRMLETFLKEYNRLHETKYHFDKEAPPDDLSCDYLCIDPSRPNTPLKIQHTLAGVDPDIERVRPKLADEFVRRYLVASINATQHCGYFISLNIDNPPRDKSERDKLGCALWECVNLKTSEQPLSDEYERIFHYRRDDEDFTSEIREYVSDFEILRKKNSTELSCVGWMSGGRGEALLDASQRAWMALDKKICHYGRSARGLTLVISFDVVPYCPQYDLTQICQVMKKRAENFLEVWVLNDCYSIPGPKAHRVWVNPLLGQTDSGA